MPFKMIVDTALAEWSLNVSEPPGPGHERIQLYLDSLRMIAKGPGGHYAKDGDAEWCGAFAGWCVLQAGLTNPELVKVKSKPEQGDLASTYRLFCLAHLSVNGRPHARLVTDPRLIASGDLMSVGRLTDSGLRRPAWGEHIVIATGIADEFGNVPTVEGNAFGKLGNGHQGQGVIRGSRPIRPTIKTKGFVFGLRFLPEDFSE